MAHLGPRLLASISLLSASTAWASHHEVEARFVAACDRTLDVAVPIERRSLHVRANAAGLLRVEEHGQDLKVQGSDVVEISTPPRLGRFTLPVRAGEDIVVTRATPGSASGRVNVVLRCNPGAVEARAMEWQRQVQALERDIAGPFPADQLDSRLLQIGRIESDAISDVEKALARHLHAQVLLMANSSEAAAKAFGLAYESWTRVGDRERASAALVGEAEDLQRVGRYAQVLAVTRTPPKAPDASSYFGVRLEESRCIAVQNLGNLDEAAPCYRWLLLQFERLGESLEYISLQQDYAQLEEDRGDLRHAAQLGEAALRLISDPRWDTVPGADVAIVRGRVERLLGDIAMRRGDIGASLRHTQRAMAQFDRSQNRRWIANTFLRVAAIYNQMGAYADALDALDQALQILQKMPRDAAPRLAIATLTKADIELSQRRVASAAKDAEQAAAEFKDLSMGAAEIAARLTQADAHLAASLPDKARAALPPIEAVPPYLRRRMELLRAEIDLAEHRDEAGARIAPPGDGPLPLSDWLRTQRLTALRSAAAGHGDAALDQLEVAARHLSALAQRSANPLLRIAILRRKQVLLQIAATLIADAEEPSAETAWRWVQLMGDSDAAQQQHTASAASVGRFDQALSQSLAEPDMSRDERHRELDRRFQANLLDLLAEAPGGPDTPADSPPLRSLYEFRRQMSPGTLFLAFLPTERGLLVLAASSNRAIVIASKASPSDFLPELDAMLQNVASFKGIATIEDEATTLSNAMFGPVRGMPLPRHLLIYAPAPLNGLPWPLLHWPGSGAALVETTSISLLFPAAGDEPRSAGVSLHLIGASEDENGNLQALGAVERELSNVADERHGQGWRIASKEIGATRDAFLRALADRGSWVHFAGHGASNVDHLGRSGLWLNSGGSDQGPDLVSWIDIAHQGIAADTVVLNACALANSPSTGQSASTGFAEAVLTAGARQVVGALWPIDDAGAAHWAAMFYASLPPRPSSDDVADAVRRAMLSVRELPRHGHPKYWASQVHLLRLGTAPAVHTAVPIH